MGLADKTIYKICAAPLGSGGRYHAWPDKVTYVRRFPSAARRTNYWRRYIASKASEQRGLRYQIAMVDEWSGGWSFVGDPLYADRPIICRVLGAHAGPIVEVG